MDKLSKIVGRLLEIMFMAITFRKNYPACQTDENGIEPVSNLNTADKRVAEPSEFFFFFFFFFFA